MGRSPQRVEMVEVDLVEDGSEHVPAPSRSDVGPRLTRLSHRVALVAIVAVLGVTAFVVDQLATPGETSALVGAAPSLSVPVRETWRVDAPHGWSIAAGLLLTSERVADDITVRAHDLGSGDVRWTLTESSEQVAGLRCAVGAEAVSGPVVLCQALGFLGPVGAGQNVAQHPGRLLVVSAADGEVLDEVALRPDHVGFTAVDGDVILVTARDSSVHVERLDLGREPTVDLAAAPVVWRADVPRDPSASISTIVAVRDGVVILASAITVMLDGSDGDLLGTWRDTVVEGSFAGRPWITTAPHGFAVRTDLATVSSPTSWHAPDGAILAEIEGSVLEPAVNDGSVPEVVLVSPPDRGNLRGVDVGAGLVRWSVDADDGLPVLRIDESVILARAGGLRSVDLRTGAENWRTTGEGLAQTEAVSDGAFVLVTGRTLGVGRTVSAVSLHDGSLLWRTALPDDARSLRAVDGHVLAVGLGVVIGLG